MNYNEALDYIHGTYRFGRKLGLDNITKLLELLGNPHKNLKFIHVAGTNGKGSTCSFLNSILLNGGYKVGLYTSPYLETFTERIRVNGENIEEEKLGEVTAVVKEQVDEMLKIGYNHPTEFEIVTAVAMKHFENEKVDFVVLEVGMGGRFDATNVIDNPLACVITPVSMDHTDYLGDTIAKIAFEKAGIIKENSSVIVYPQEKDAQDTIEEVAKQKNATILNVSFESKKIISSNIYGQEFEYTLNGEKLENIKIKLIGEHQVNNAIVAINTIDYLNKNGYANISKENISKGLYETKWPGRIELLKDNPLIIIDGAHNEDGALSLANAVDKYFKDKTKTLVIGMLKDKDVNSVLDILIPRFDKVITTMPDSDRSLTAKELKEYIVRFDKDIKDIESIKESIDYVMKNSSKDEIIIFAGSLYMIGEARHILTRL